MHQDRCPSFQDIMNVREGRWRKRLQRQEWSYLMVIENANVGDLSLIKLFVLAVFRTPFLNNMKVNLEDNMDVTW